MSVVRNDTDGNIMAYQFDEVNDIVDTKKVLTRIFTNGTYQTLGSIDEHTLKPIAPGDSQLLIVAGGGSGGGPVGSGGGGGAGELVYTTANLVSSYYINIGSGGSGVGSGQGHNGQNTYIQDTVSGKIIHNAIGGGGGGANSTVRGLDGGSGGGGGEAFGAASHGGNSIAVEGYGSHGANASSSLGPGGGGGAGGTGGTESGRPDNGGPGLTYDISGTNVTYANGGVVSATSAISPTTYGGGGGATTSGNPGIIIISYYGAAKATGGTITTVGTNTVHTFTSSGNFTPTRAITKLRQRLNYSNGNLQIVGSFDEVTLPNS
jgi:hypothetical protein